MATRNFENKAELEANYTHYDTCGCGGALTYKYRKTGTKKEIWVKPTMGMFQQFNDGLNIYSGKLSKLKEKL